MSKSRIPLRLIAFLSICLFIISLTIPGVNDWSIWLLKLSSKLVGFLLILVLCIVWWGQGYLLYMPHFAGRFVSRENDSNPAGFRSPSEHELPYTDHYITCSDGVVIHAWFVSQPSPLRESAPTIIFLHGNAGNIGFRLFNTKAMYDVCQCNVLMVEYRGFGLSAGTPSELGLKRDAVAALSFLHSLPDINHRKIFLFGRSLGGGVSISLAHENSINQSIPLAGVILENTFTSIEDMVVVLAQRVLPLNRLKSVLRFILNVFMTSHWKSIDMIGSISCPLLFISGMLDELVPASQMQQLYDASINSSSRHIHYVADGDHNSTYLRGGIEYWRCFASFVHSRCAAIDEKHDSTPPILSKWQQ